MARNNNKPDVYKGRRKKLNVLGIVLSAVAVLIVAVFVLYGAFQKYIVYSNNGISLELPILATPGAEEEEGERVFEQVNAELEITDPDYSDIESQIDEEMEPLRAIFVPAENVNTEGITPYVNKLNSVGGNALVLEVKPSSGQLVWATSVQLAADYGTAGTTDLGVLANTLKEQNIYLVAQLSCCTDDLLAQRYPAAALTLPGGTPYSDEDGYWVDPYNATVSQYLTDLCRELVGYGFDELLFKNLAMPQTESQLNYTVKLSSIPTPTSAVCGLAMDLTTALANSDVLCSAILDTTSLRNGLSAKSGQDLSIFTKLFDRLCSSAGSIWQATVDRSSVDYWMYDGDLSLRFIPILGFQDTTGTFANWVYRVPEGML